ncbi:MAG TPA: hypothetical protein VFI76_06330 [Terrimicrobiaceae bacterium]|nr:hypothetical protein [Terrimicrobiaceae bacterium]
MEKAIADGIDKEFKRMPRPPAAELSFASMAEQLLNMAETVKSLHRDIDALQQDFINKLNELRDRLGSK